MKIKEVLCFDDVLLQPHYSDVSSREELFNSLNVDLYNGSVGIGYNLPIIAAPMDRVISEKMNEQLVKYGAGGIIHRYNTIEEQKRLWSHTSDVRIGCAIGVVKNDKKNYMERVAALYSEGCMLFCIDVAHGHHNKVQNAVEELKAHYGNDIMLMAGNVATYEAYKDLVSWGVDIVRVGIGGSGVCTTRVNTGHGIPTFQSIIDCARAKDEVGGYLLADGGFKTTGDIVKGLAAGADMVMLGYMLACTDCSPGRILTIDDKKYKEYRGMSSAESQIDWRGEVRSLEGVSGLVKYEGRTEDRLDDIGRQLRSGLSYSGVRTIKDLQEKAEWVKISSGGFLESGVRV